MRPAPTLCAACLAVLAATSAVTGPARAEPVPHRVTGLAPGEPLAIRAEPDAGAEQVGAIRTRALVFGCTNATPGGTTWCRVKSGPVVGWARRRYLSPE